MRLASVAAAFATDLMCTALLAAHDYDPWGASQGRRTRVCQG